MKALIEYLVSQLVDDPEQAEVIETRHDDSVTYAVRVAPPDLGKVIGKQGRIANALRLVAKAGATRTHERVYVDIET